MWKNSSDTIKFLTGEIKRVHAFPKVINPKVNLIAWLEFELVYSEAAVQHFSHHAMKITPKIQGEVGSCISYMFENTRKSQFGRVLECKKIPDSPGSFRTKGKMNSCLSNVFGQLSTTECLYIVLWVELVSNVCIYQNRKGWTIRSIFSNGVKLIWDQSFIFPYQG